MTSKGTKVLSWVLALALVFAALTPLTFKPRAAHAAISAVSFTPASLDVNTVTQYTVAFTSGATLTNDVATITVKFPSGVVLPSAIAKERVAVGGGGTSIAQTPLEVDPVVDVSLRTVTMTAPGAANFTAGAMTVFFSQLAGITNPAAGGAAGVAAATTAGSVATSAEAEVAAGAVVTYAFKITRSPTSGKRATAATLAIEGFKAATTATAKVTTANVTYTLGSTTVGSDGKGTISYTINVPQFAAGANTITVTDGAGNSKTASVTLSPTLTLTPTSGVVGALIAVSGTDWTATETITSGTGIVVGGANAGGLNAAGTAGATITATGTGAISGTLKVPSLALGVVTVIATGSTAGAVSTTFTVTGAPVTLSPSSAVADTKITITGSGFANSDTLPQNTGITIGGVAWNTAAAVSTTSSGDFNTQLTLTGTMGLTAGDYEVAVTDSTGRTGTATFTVPARTLTLSPSSSFRGTTVTATGTNYAKSSTVTITYGNTTVATTTADSAGAIAVTFTVPTSADYVGTGTGNTVTATSVAADANSLTKTAKHVVPNAVISLSASSGASGTSLTVSGINFPLFTDATAFTIGGVTVGGGTVGGTDSAGTFSKAVTVPSLATGPTTVVVTIGGVTGSATFTVSAAVVTVASSLTALANAAGGSVVSSVWYRDNATQTWQTYAAGAPSDLTTLVKGRPYIVMLSADPASTTWVTPSGSSTVKAGFNLIVY